MKYVVVDTKNGDCFTSEYESKDAAVKAAQEDWERFSGYEKRIRSEYFVLESVNPDEEAVDHLDGDVVVDFQTWYAVMRDDDDDDWGTGSYFLEEAEEMLEQYPEGYIAVINNNVCIKEIRS